MLYEDILWGKSEGWNWVYMEFRTCYFLVQLLSVFSFMIWSACVHKSQSSRSNGGWEMQREKSKHEAKSNKKIIKENMQRRKRRNFTQARVDSIVKPAPAHFTLSVLYPLSYKHSHASCFSSPSASSLSLFSSLLFSSLLFLVPTNKT